MTTPDIGAIAEALMGARRGGKALDPADWQAAVPDMDAAYAVQAAVADAQGWFAGGAPRAWKSGGPSRSQVLTHAPLPPAGVRMSPADYGDMRFFAPLIEIEVALRLARAVSAETAAALAAAADRADEPGRAEPSRGHLPLEVPEEVLRERPEVRRRVVRLPEPPVQVRRDDPPVRPVPVVLLRVERQRLVLQHGERAVDPAPELDVVLEMLRDLAGIAGEAGKRLERRKS